MNHRIFSRSLSAINGTGEDGVFNNVSLITTGPALGHDLEIDSVTLRQVLAACQRFERGVRVNLNHFSGVQAAIGFIDTLRICGAKLLGTLHLFKEHPDFALTVRQIQEIADTIAFSLFFTGEDEKIDGTTRARCSQVFSCDLVCEGASNPTGVFSRGSGTTIYKTFHEACRGIHALSNGKSKVASMRAAIEQYPELYRTFELGQRNCESWTREPLFVNPERDRRRLAIIARGMLI